MFRFRFLSINLYFSIFSYFKINTLSNYRVSISI